MVQESIKMDGMQPSTENPSCVQMTDSGSVGVLSEPKRVANVLGQAPCLIAFDAQVTWKEAWKSQQWLVFIAVVIVILIPTGILEFTGQPRSRFFSSADETIAYPGPNTDSFGTIYFLLTYLLMVAIIFLMEFVFMYRGDTRRNHPYALWSALYFSLDAGICVIFTIGLTSFLKYYVGRLRPDFLARCELPDTYTLGNPYNGNNYSLCTNDAKIVKEGRLSYPSGHSSLAIAQGFYLFSYLIWTLYVRPQSCKARAFDRARSHLMEQVVELVRCVFLFIGPAGAMFIAASRIADYKHHPSDVNAGIIVGVLVSILTFARGLTLYLTVHDRKCSRVL
eukprot:comp20773_c0_seq1/m.27268 comp20773_c0_seq1/g.27268  ORF comp20773_c0_seq1/g.27268 comp20773_c0_seq1/m.27268 type:complete len:336 (-) comp20773_c0_seq1:829-1836(-)